MTSKFWSPDHILSYNRQWMITIGSRSIGKSTGWMIYLLKQYMEKGERFIYIRRTDDEVKLTAKTCCDSACIILNIHSVEANRGYFLLKRKEDSEPEICGMYFSLSMAYKYKSANFGDNNYKNIIYDEFINIDKTKYLGTKDNITYEFDRALELYQTVDRRVGKPFTNETKFIFVANLATYYNPIFIGLGIDKYLRTDSKNIAPKGKQWVVEQINKVEATNDYKDSVAYKLADNKNKQYAYENVAFDEKMNFVAKINKPMYGLFDIRYNNETFGVYKLKDYDVLYICQHSNKIKTVCITSATMDQIDYTLAIRPSDSYLMSVLKQYYYIGRVISENKHIRYIISNYFMLTP